MPVARKVKVAQPFGRSSCAAVEPASRPGRRDADLDPADPEAAVVRDLDPERDVVARTAARPPGSSTRRCGRSTFVDGDRRPRSPWACSSSTTAVRADTACEVPPSFDAVSTTRRRAPTSAEVSRYVAPVAPGTVAQPSPAVLQRCQKNAFVIVPGPVHVAAGRVQDLVLHRRFPARSGVPVACGVVIGFGAIGTRRRRRAVPRDVVALLAARGVVARPAVALEDPLDEADPPPDVRGAERVEKPVRAAECRRSRSMSALQRCQV